MSQLRAERAALAVIDIQEKLGAAMDPTAMEDIAANLPVLADLALRFELPLIKSEQYPRGLGPSAPFVIEALAPLETLALEKTEFSLCRNSAFEPPPGRTQWIVLGMETHICVLQTVRDLRLMGHEVFVVADAVASRSARNRDIGLGLMKDVGAFITCTETVVFDLLGTAAGEDFKALSRMIR